MFSLEGAYAHAPIMVQNTMATGFGVRERYLRYGGDFQRFCHEIDRNQWLARGALEELQAARLREMVSFAVDHVPYYQNLFGQLGLVAADISCATDLTVLPVLEKQTVRAAPELFRPTGLRERPVPQSTGGTTGTPLRYWVTPSAMQYTYATYEVRFRNWAGVKLGDRMASINGRKIVPVGQSKPPFWRHNLAFNQIYLSAYHLTDEYLPAYISKLQSFQPKVVVGYVSSVHLLASYINQNGLAGSICPTAVLVSSETLFPWIRAEIESAFSCKVYDGYGLGELSAFITECSHGGMHIHPEYGVVEGVEEGGDQRLVATGLFNRAMPLLRYDTGDVIEFGDPGRVCACGRELPLAERLLGRADDYVVTPDGRSVGPAPLSLAFQSVIGIREAQILQEEESSVTVFLVVDEGFGEDKENQLDHELRERLGEVLEINYERVPAIERTTWGKRRLVDSRVGRRSETLS